MLTVKHPLQVVLPYRVLPLLANTADEMSYWMTGIMSIKRKTSKPGRDEAIFGNAVDEECSTTPAFEGVPGVEFESDDDDDDDEEEDGDGGDGGEGISQRETETDEIKSEEPDHVSFHVAEQVCSALKKKKYIISDAAESMNLLFSRVSTHTPILLCIPIYTHAVTHFLVLAREASSLSCGGHSTREASSLSCGGHPTRSPNAASAHSFFRWTHASAAPPTPSST